MLLHVLSVLLVSISGRRLWNLMRIVITLQMGIIFKFIFPLDGNTYRGCFSELDAGIQETCKRDNLGKNCTLCENINGVKGCNNAVSL